MTVVIFGALVWKVVDFMRLLFNITTNRSAIITQATAWIGGIVLVVIAAHAGVAKLLVLPGTDSALGTLDFASQILAGLLIASFASTVVDIKQAIDNGDSSAMPPMVPPAPPAPPAA